MSEGSMHSEKTLDQNRPKASIPKAEEEEE
jgi:hypothetical protein